MVILILSENPEKSDSLLRTQMVFHDIAGRPSCLQAGREHHLSISISIYLSLSLYIYVLAYDYICYIIILYYVLYYYIIMMLIIENLY